MIKNERVFTLIYSGGAPAGTAHLRSDGSLLVRPDRGSTLVVNGLAEAVLEEHAAYIAWRESQGGTPGVPPSVVFQQYVDQLDRLYAARSVLSAHSSAKQEERAATDNLARLWEELTEIEQERAEYLHEMRKAALQAMESGPLVDDMHQDGATDQGKEPS